MAELVRVAALSGYFEVMAALGADPRPLLREQGLSADLLREPEQPIAAQAIVRLLERSAAVTGCETLGLRMAEGRTLANLGATSLLIAHQPSLRQSLEALREFRARINSTLVLDYQEAGDEVLLREGFSLARPEPWRQALDLALGVLAKLCSAALGEGWNPRAVCFTHAAPPRAELPIYARVFGCRPLFDAAFDGIVVARADLDRPNPRADSQLAHHARQLLAAAGPNTRTRADEVEALITMLLPSGRASVQVCAASMGLTVRSLQRALDAEGARFSGLLNRVRARQATQLLAHSALRITDIADLLGYGSVGAFSRWYAGVFGLPPRRARGVARGGGLVGGEGLEPPTLSV